MTTIIEPRRIVPGYYLGLEEAARRASLSVRTLNRAIADGKLPSFKLGSRRLIEPEALDVYVRTEGGAAR